MIVVQSVGVEATRSLQCKIEWPEGESKFRSVLEIRLSCENLRAILAYKGVTTSIQRASLFKVGLYPGT